MLEALVYKPQYRGSMLDEPVESLRVAQGGQRVQKISGMGRLEAHAPAGSGMNERELKGVEHLARGEVAG